MCEGLVLAVGDIVSQQSAVAGALFYQPAAGVEIIITAVFQGNASAHDMGLTDGAGNDSYVALGGIQDQMNVKIGITNSVFWHMSSTATLKAGFTGIQIK